MKWRVTAIQPLITIQENIDRCIKYIWVNQIPKDYKARSLLLEGSLKNAIYHHLRVKIGDQYLLNNNIRIFTEFKIGLERAYLAIVRIDPLSKGSLYELVLEVLAIIEIEYKCGISDMPFHNDVKKVLRYMKKDRGKCQYYLAFIQEVIYYEPLDDFSWLTKKQLSQTENQLTEMTSMCGSETEETSWFIRSDNRLT